MYQFSVTIQGTAPLLTHRLDPQVVIDAGKGAGKRKRESAFEGNPEEWKTGCYWKEGVGLFVAADALETCMKQASSSGGYKVGSPKRPARQYVESGLILSPQEGAIQLPKAASKDLAELSKLGPYVFNGGRPDFVDMRPIRINKAGRQCRYRVIIPAGWLVTFSGEMLHDEIGPELLQEIFSYAGVFKGLYEYRPKLGRFAVSEFRTVK